MEAKETRSFLSRLQATGSNKTSDTVFNQQNQRGFCSDIATATNTVHQKRDLLIDSISDTFLGSSLEGAETASDIESMRKAHLMCNMGSFDGYQRRSNFHWRI